MANPAYYDFFRKIRLMPDGITIEADSVTDTVTIESGTGVDFGIDTVLDKFTIGVDYQLSVPLATTSIELIDINSNTSTVALTAGNNITLTRVGSAEIRIDADDVSEIIGDVQQISGPGAIALDKLITEITTTGTDDAFTLADGTLGQVKIIAMVADGGDAIITPTTLATGNTITFSDVNDNITLLYTSNGWLNTANQNATIA
jgi:hypothetical protein